MTLDTASAVASLNALTAKFDFRMKETVPYYPNICTIVPSKRRGEDYGFLGKSKGMREWVGDRQFNKLRSGRFHLENKLWEDSIEIERDDIEDDILGIYDMAFEQCAKEAAMHPDELVFDLLVAGDSAVTWDGQYFFDTDHAWGDSGDQSNDLTHTAATGTAPTVAEFQAAFSEMIVALVGFKNDAGKLYHRPTVGELTDLTLMVPPLMWETAKIAIQAAIIAQTSNVLLATPKVIAVPYLADSATCYLFYTGDPIKPFVFQARRPLVRSMKGMDDREFKNVKFMTDARYNVGYLAWWNAIRMQFT